MSFLLFLVYQEKSHIYFLYEYMYSFKNVDKFNVFANKSASLWRI